MIDHVTSNGLIPVIQLFHRRYAVPLIACLHTGKGAKFVTLVHRLGASRDTVSITLKDLIENGIVIKNPGYGHPMRPEYILTDLGERLGPACAATVDVVTEMNVGEIAFKKWSMPVVTAIGRGANRFGILLQSLNGVTPRALTGALRELDRRDVVAREVTDTWPPHPRYRLASTGEALMPTLNQLCVAASR